MDSAGNLEMETDERWFIQVGILDERGSFHKTVTFRGDKKEIDRIALAVLRGWAVTGESIRGRLVGTRAGIFNHYICFTKDTAPSGYTPTELGL